ncbi:DUF6167 family protein [Streptomyces scopuliridis]|uniref:Secreted protein n=2 Tax=Streptomyces scopuliridis TaxID=452529 RepID=A0A2T7SX44_9ACTN|nr:DUF6167 family protein [Streptomyces scopuliridis]PVE07500.1 hypothetical protein Y717_23690 [Streptomyces scopuliridis RB72]WSB36848.1 DUF6167 family protein [Streptomyces scopuliridis]WSC01169.1 DUF6167 family protein [Streptomyces scopuliridis]WSC05220.1 DUF6167 family protein [Streptomyces scopuliridis]
MFRRTFWFTAGAAAGVWATTKVHRKLKQLTPESLAAQAANKAIDAGHKVREFAVDVKAGMVRREAELGEALGLEAPADPALPAPRRLAAIEYTEQPRTVYSAHPQNHHPRHYDPHNRNEDH